MGEVAWLEVVRYDVARKWFWMRTWFWFVPLVILSIMFHFGYAREAISSFNLLIKVSLGQGFITAFIGLVAAIASIQFPWMINGWRIAFLINGPACAASAGVVTFLLGSIVIAILSDNPPNPITEVQKFQAYTHANAIAQYLFKFGIGASAFWGFVLGSWFALRRDKYFVEIS